MSTDSELVRLNPFEGLCLTAGDLLAEQRYHRESLARHARFLSGHGIVQGLGVEVEQRLDRFEARIRAGFGLTHEGHGVHLPADLTVKLEEQQADGEYLLWLVREEVADPDAHRPVFDVADQSHSARVVERVAPRLLPAEQDVPHGVALAHIRVRLQRMSKIDVPVPRAGRVLRAAESALKPVVNQFIERNRRILELLLRTAILQELSITAYGFYAALVSAEFLLIEEGTADRVLYRSAGTLVRHGRRFYDSDAVRNLTDRLVEVAELMRALDDRVPAAHHEDREFQTWFEGFQRLLPPLSRAVEELEATANPDRDRG